MMEWNSKQAVILYVATLITMVVLDGVWIGGVARGFYKERIGDLMELHLAPAVIFYLFYVAGVVYFTSGADTATLKTIFLKGALLGLLAYGTYDLTNLATLKGWSLSLVLVDMAWGTLVTAIAATAGCYVANYFQP